MKSNANSMRTILFTSDTLIVKKTEKNKDFGSSYVGRYVCAYKIYIYIPFSGSVYNRTHQIWRHVARLPLLRIE